MGSLNDYINIIQGGEIMKYIKPVIKSTKAKDYVILSKSAKCSGSSSHSTTTS